MQGLQDQGADELAAIAHQRQLQDAAFAKQKQGARRRSASPSHICGAELREQLSQRQQEIARLRRQQDELQEFNVCSRGVVAAAMMPRSPSARRRRWRFARWNSSLTTWLLHTTTVRPCCVAARTAIPAGVAALKSEMLQDKLIFQRESAATVREIELRAKTVGDPQHQRNRMLMLHRRPRPR